MKQLEAKGIAISKLIIEESFTGLFGQHTITLRRKPQQGITPPLPSNSFSCGKNKLFLEYNYFLIFTVYII